MLRTAIVPSIPYPSMEEDDIVTVWSDVAMCVPISTAFKDRGSERIISPLIPMIFLTSEGRNIKRTMASGLGYLVSIPTAG